MGDRTILGPADLDDEALASLVAAQLGVPAVQVSTCDVEVADYDIEALTTAGRYWVRGTAEHGGGRSSYAFFVKVVQSWTRTPVFQRVPEHLREIAGAGLPWRNEPVVYRSDLGERLPAGLSMPEAYAVLDLDEKSGAMWLREVDVDPVAWQPATFARAAYLLGRLAASEAVSPLSALGTQDIVRGYASGRIEHQVLPVLHSDDLWRHPLVAEAFDADLRSRLLAAADALPSFLAELDDAPLGTAHGDACPRNLLVERGAADAFVLIDFGFWCRAPLGFDLSQLLLGEVQLGRGCAAALPDLDRSCLAAYLAGLRAEGSDISEAQLWRAHALTMLLFAGLSAVPVEVMFGLPAFPLEVARERATALRFILDLVDSTTPYRRSPQHAGG